MKLTDEFDRPPKGVSMMHIGFLAITVIVLVIVIVLFVNQDKLFRNNNTKATVMDDEAFEDKKENSPSADEVWESIVATPDGDVAGEKEESKDDNSGDTPGTDSESEADNGSEDTYSEETHTLLEYDDGMTEWIEISSKIKRNEYDYSNLSWDKPFYSYSENGKNTSYNGVMISKDQGLVDFLKVKKSGVDFCIITLGYRGNQTGTLMTDEYFATNMKNAKDAGLKIGVMFVSSAVSIEEAEEEADYVTGLLADYSIQYPVFFTVAKEEGNSSRTVNVHRYTRTEYATAFLDKIREAGYIPMLYDTKEGLIKKYNLVNMEKYDKGLVQLKEEPDYPYRFQIWNYGQSDDISGVSGAVDMCISFIDYSVQ